MPSTAQRNNSFPSGKAGSSGAKTYLALERDRLRDMLETRETEDHRINRVTTLDIALRARSMQWEIDARLEAEARVLPVDKQSVINIEHFARAAMANAMRKARS